MFIVNARFLTQSITGVQRYAIEISLRLKEINPSIRFLVPKNVIHLDLAKLLDVEIIGENTGYYWEQIELPNYLKKIGSPLLINLANMAPIFYKNKVISLHDIAFVKFPSGFSWKFKLIYKLFIPLILKSSKKIITISQFSKKEIMNYYHVNSKNIEVIYNGIDQNFCKKEKKFNERYILGVSSLDYRKNFKGLIQGYLKISNPNFKLYIIGEQNSVFQNIDIKFHDNIQFLGRVTDENLVQYYSDAMLFIYPSFYEGFGFPPLEAMACGTPVICSDNSSIPEVCGDAVIYCNPHDINDIKYKIEFVLSNKNLQKEMIFKGLEQAKLFSWEKSAEKHIQVFQKVLNN